MGASVYLFGRQVCPCLNFFRTVWPSFVTYICRIMCPNSWSNFWTDDVRVNGVKRWVC